MFIQLLCAESQFYLILYKLIFLFYPLKKVQFIVDDIF